ncbi:MAG: LysR family transcriptional regulator [Myxococcaceae bacterium]|nr:LysR family transcriptional regulator [Myxococcaceae bacterium]
MDTTDLNAVRVFVAIVETKGVRLAARALGLPRSTVSRKLAELEARLGLSLLNRTTRTVSLTDAGQAYFARAVQALGALDDAERALREAGGRPTGTLRITASPAMAQQRGGELLARFLTDHPDVRVVLDLSERHVDLVAEGFDVALRGGPMVDSTLVARQLRSAQAYLYASRGYLKARGTPKTLADLERHDCIVHGSSAAAPQWTFMVGRTRKAVPVQARLVANNLAVVRAAVEAGLGIGWLPDISVDGSNPNRKLVRVLTDFPLPRAVLNVVYPPTRNLSPSVRAFVDACVKAYGSPAAQVR